MYGKVYFPVRSNGLKPLGRFLGAAWTDPQASGLQSLVWRHRWEMTRDERFKQSLLQYNREDCEAVRLLVDRLDQIRRDAASDPTIEFASRPKRHATETGKAVHGQFERILKSAQVDSAGRGIRIRETGTEEADAPTKQERRKGHPAFRRIVPKASRTVLVEPRQRCPKHDVRSRAEAEETGREDGHRPRLHRERVQEDGHEVRRDQEPLPEVRGALQPGLVSDGIRMPSGTASRPGRSTSESSFACPTTSSPR